jgi:SAM-dependent methyltransferase
MLSRIPTYRNYGLGGLVSAAFHQVFPLRARCLPLVKEIVGTGVGLEIGGPSPVFRASGILPIYSRIANLDNCNFSSETQWEGKITAGKSFQYHPRRAVGNQYVCEASNLESIETGSYDFLLSSHVIEHLANPLRGLHEWLRVLKASGYLILILPHYAGTFDHQRPVTRMDHLIDDFGRGIKEDDLTHLAEILQLHDLAMDPGAGSFEDFEARSRWNFENRCLHHHVFDNSLTIQLMSYMNLQILSFENIKPHHIIVIARKSIKGEFADNNTFAAIQAERISKSPFH